MVGVVSPLLECGSWVLNAGHQPWQQEPSCWSPNFFFHNSLFWKGWFHQLSRKVSGLESWYSEILQCPPFLFSGFLGCGRIVWAKKSQTSYVFEVLILYVEVISGT